MLRIFLVPYDASTAFRGTNELTATARQLCLELLDVVRAYWIRSRGFGYERIRVVVPDDVLGTHVRRLVEQRITSWGTPFDVVALPWAAHEQPSLLWEETLRKLHASYRVLCVCMADLDQLSHLYRFFVEHHALPGLVWKRTEALQLDWNRGTEVSFYEFFSVRDGTKQI